MTEITSDVLLFSKSPELTAALESHLQAIGYMCRSSDDPTQVKKENVAMAIVYGSHEEMQAALGKVEQLSQARHQVLVMQDAENDYAAELFREKGAEAVCLMPFDSTRFQIAFDDIVRKRDRIKYSSSMPQYSKTLLRLTPRERRVVELAADGRPNKQIASNVNLSVKSIERIRRDAYRKLNVRSTAEMTRVFLLGSLYTDLGGPNSRPL